MIPQHDGVAVHGVLITGSRGFIGAALLGALGAAPIAQPIVLAGRSPNPSVRLPGCRQTLLDLTAPAFELPGDIHTVVHLAGEKRDPAHMDAVNHLGAARLVEAAARAGVRRFVHLSSVGVYGAAPHAGLVDTAHAHAPRTAYEISKDHGESAVRERCQALGLQCLVLQPSTVIGIVPGRSHPLLGLARSVARGWFRHIGAGDAWVNYVAVQDVAAALVAALAAPGAAGVQIVNTPAPLRDLVGWIADELGVPPPSASLPRWIAAGAAAAGGLGRMLLRRELPFSPERFVELTNTTRFDGDTIVQTLGFRYPTGIEAAVRAMMRAYCHDGLI